MKFPSRYIIKWITSNTDLLKIYTNPSKNSISVGNFFRGESIEIDKKILINSNEKWVSYIGFSGKRRYVLLPSKDQYLAFPPFGEEFLNNDNDIVIKTNNNYCKYIQHYEYGCFHWQGNPFLETNNYEENCWLCNQGSKLLCILKLKEEEPNEENIRKYCTNGIEEINNIAQLGKETKIIQEKSIACFKGREHFVYLDKVNNDLNTFTGFDPQIGEFFHYDGNIFDVCYPFR